MRGRIALIVMSLAMLIFLPLMDVRHVLSRSVYAVSTPEPSPSATPDTSEPLQYGNSVKRTFSADSGPFLFTFDAQLGDVITLTMVADRDQPLDPALVLRDPDANIVAQNDDSFDSSFGPLNARLVNFPIPASGTYTIEANRSSDADGSFTLALRGSRGQKTSAAVIDYGQVIRGTISDSGVNLSYQFHANQGDVISVAVQSAPNSGLIPYVVLMGTKDEKLTSSNPAERTSKTARITAYPIQIEGTYTLVVTRVGEDKGTSSGDFSLTVEKSKDGPRAS